MPDSKKTLPYQYPELPVSERIDDLLERMTLLEKIGQMAQVSRNHIPHAEITKNGIGSILSGGGDEPPEGNTPQNWAKMVRSYQEAALETRLSIPLIYGVDAVHGHNNVRGAVIFPHNIGLGAAGDAELMRQIGEITATEILATGIPWDFAPTVAAPQDIRWGRTYEGYSENTSLVSRLGAAFTRGLQGEDPDCLRALVSLKHFVGDGGTIWESTRHLPWVGWWFGGLGKTWVIDQGDMQVDETILRAIHLPPYQAAIEAGAMSIMVSYSSWNRQKMHAHTYLLTDVLKGELGFEGFLISDYLAIDQLEPNYLECVVTSINAGLDMIMIPFDYMRFIRTLNYAVENEMVSMARIDDAVCRILNVKFRLGLFEQPFGDDTLLTTVGSDEHREVARQAVRQSCVLLKNEHEILPLKKDTPRIYIAGEGADNIGLQCGGWTIEWGGGSGPITEGTTILEGIKQTVAESAKVKYKKKGKFSPDKTNADIGIVVVGETPYSEGTGDREDLSLSEKDIKLIKRMHAICERLVVILISGRPLIITDVLDQCDAFVTAWLPGTEGQGIADVLFGDYAVTGKMSYTWPSSMDQVPLSALTDSGEEPLFPFGYGLTTQRIT